MSDGAGGYMISKIEMPMIKLLSNNNTTFQNGQDYFQNGHVLSVIYDPTYKNYQAKVEGNQIYQVKIQLNETNRIDDATCTCPAFDSFPGYCKHMIAVMLFLHEYKQSKSNAFNKVTNLQGEQSVQANTLIIKNIIDQFQKDRFIGDRNPSHEQLQVQYIVELMPSPSSGIDRWFTIQMKVGCERLYVVKNVREFFHSYKNKQPLLFSKKFIYEPNNHQLSDEDTTIFQFLLNILDGEQVYQQLLDPWSTGRINKRLITIPPNQVGSFLELLPQGNFLFENEWQSQTELSVITGECPITFTINKQKDDFVLQSYCGKSDWNADGPFLLSEDGYGIALGKIYKFNPVQQELVLNLHRRIQQSKEGKFLIYSEQMDHFASIVLPVLKKEAQLQIERPIEDQIVQLPLHTGVYLDRIWKGEREQITAEVVHRYGDYTINPFQEEGSKKGQKILIRDTDKEQQIMSIFENAGFKYNGKELHLDDEGLLYIFLHEKISQLKTHADIYTTESMDNVISKPLQQAVPQIEMDASNRWLEFHFELPDVSEEELQEILQAFVEKKSYYRLSDGAFVSLPDEIGDSLHSLIDEEPNRKSIMADHKIKLPIYRAMQVAEILEKNTVIKKGQRFRRLIRSMKDPENLDFTLPPSLAPILRDYQVFGFQWLKTLDHYGFGGILADDMGLGKTLQAIAFIVSKLEQQSTKSKTHEIPALVVVPASLIYNWEKECSQFAPQLKTTVIAGSKVERQELLADLSDTEVLITSYPLLRKDIELYKDCFFETLILDEAQSFKNQRSQTAQSVKRIHAGTCFALSGTPIENRLDELWSICDIVMPGLFPQQKTFRKLPVQQIARRIRPFILRRMKQDVLTELPDKIESVQLLDLTAEQKKLYLASLKKIQSDTQQYLKEDEFQKNRMKVLAGLTRLRQICCHPSLYIENYTADSGKFTYFFDTLDDLLSNGHRVLVFSQFTSMLALMMEQLHDKNIPFHYLDGKTPGRERLEMVDRFNSGEHDLFLISLRAGGTGLNLTGADTVILYDLWWNPAVEQQATDRAHRMGQDKKVQVFKLVSQGTIEEKIYELQMKKRALFDSIIQPGEQMLSALSEDDIKEILDLT